MQASEHDLRPLLWTVPDTMLRHAPVLRHLGVADLPEPRHYIRGLQQLAAQHAGSPRLDDHQLSIAVAMAVALGTLVAGQDPAERELGLSRALFLPDSTGVLAPAGSLFFNDAEWLIGV